MFAKIGGQSLILSGDTNPGGSAQRASQVRESRKIRPESKHSKAQQTREEGSAKPKNSQLLALLLFPYRSREQSEKMPRKNLNNSFSQVNMQAQERICDSSTDAGAQLI
jgi:hypothetical protein